MLHWQMLISQLVSLFTSSSIQLILIGREDQDSNYLCRTWRDKYQEPFSVVESGREGCCKEAE
jgi:hypothetical protein